MPEHPIVLIAEETVAQGGTGLELLPLLSKPGAHLRVWVPTLEAARAVAAVGRACRLEVGPPLTHLDTPGSVHGRGFQIVTYIPGAQLAAAAEAMRSEAVALASTPALPEGTTAELT